MAVMLLSLGDSLMLQLLLKYKQLRQGRMLEKNSSEMDKSNMDSALL